MMNAKLLSIATAVLVAGSAMAQNAKLGATYAAQNARETLFRAMEISGKINVESIVLRKGWGNGPSMQFKFEQSDRGMSKYTVLAPLCDQNVVRYEDKRYWKNFNPESGQLLVQKTSGVNTLGIRQALAEQNYRFTTEDGEKIAGRTTVVIVAMPKAGVMPSRRYSIDVAKMYLLRVETDQKGDRQVLTDTLAVSFPKGIFVRDPEREFFSQFQKIELDPPMPVPDAKKLTETVGFRPSLPQDLPYGFAIIEKQATGQDYDTVAIRISDGLANATIFQTKNVPQNRGSSKPSNSRAEANGIHFKLIGDLPDPVTRRILEMFVREAMKGLMPLLETSFTARLLDDSQNIDAPVVIRVIIQG